MKFKNWVNDLELEEKELLTKDLRLIDSDFAKKFIEITIKKNSDDLVNLSTPEYLAGFIWFNLRPETSYKEYDVIMKSIGVVCRNHPNDYINRYWKEVSQTFNRLPALNALFWELFRDHNRLIDLYNGSVIGYHSAVKEKDQSKIKIYKEIIESLIIFERKMYENIIIYPGFKEASITFLEFAKNLDDKFIYNCFKSFLDFKGFNKPFKDDEETSDENKSTPISNNIVTNIVNKIQDDAYKVFKDIESKANEESKQTNNVITKKIIHGTKTIKEPDFDNGASEELEKVKSWQDNEDVDILHVYTLSKDRVKIEQKKTYVNASGKNDNCKGETLVEILELQRPISDFEFKDDGREFIVKYPDSTEKSYRLTVPYYLRFTNMALVDKTKHLSDKEPVKVDLSISVNGKKISTDKSEAILELISKISNS